MPDELMTTRELEEFLKVDRTTLYSMLKEGSLPGFKVGGQWRFSRQEIESWLKNQQDVDEEAPARPSPEVLSIESVGSIQSIFSEALGVGSIVTQLDGTPLTQTTNSCAFCDLILSTPEGLRRCAESWRALASQQQRKPRLHRCHAGLFYARGRIEVEDEFVAMVFAGQIMVDGNREIVASRIDDLGAACGLDPERLRELLPSIRSLDSTRSDQLISLLEQMGRALAGIGRERLVLVKTLRHIAKLTAF
jgi:excisionase family DNA binding protein